MKVLTIALATVVWSTLPHRSHLDYRQYNRKLHRGVKIETRHIPVTRAADNGYFENNRKRRSKNTDLSIRSTTTKRRSKNWKQSNRKFHK